MINTTVVSFDSLQCTNRLHSFFFWSFNNNSDRRKASLIPSFHSRRHHEENWIMHVRCNLSKTAVSII